MYWNYEGRYNFSIISVNKYLFRIYVSDAKPGTVPDNENVVMNNYRCQLSSQGR